MKMKRLYLALCLLMLAPADAWVQTRKPMTIAEW